MAFIYRWSLDQVPLYMHMYGTGTMSTIVYKEHEEAACIYIHDIGTALLHVLGWSQLSQKSQSTIIYIGTISASTELQSIVHVVM